MRKLFWAVAGVLLLLVAVACSGRSKLHATATTAKATTTTTAPSAPFAARSTECSDRINVAADNVKTLLYDAPATVGGASTPVVAAEKLRADAAATAEIVENARKLCQSVMIECPDVADAYAQYLKDDVGSITDMANTLLGGPSPSTSAAGKPPDLNCNKRP